MWTALSGSFDIRLVDDHGRAVQAALSVEMVQLSIPFNRSA
jgi:hypothetical protein